MVSAMTANNAPIFPKEKYEKVITPTKGGTNYLTKHNGTGKSSSKVGGNGIEWERIGKKGFAARNSLLVFAPHFFYDEASTFAPTFFPDRPLLQGQRQEWGWGP